MVGIVAIGMAAGDTEDPLADQVLERVPKEEGRNMAIIDGDNSNDLEGRVILGGGVQVADLSVDDFII